MDSTSSICPPNGPLEVAFLFNSTYSKESWLDELRGRFHDMIQRLQADIPGIKMAVFTHGDSDTPHHVTKWTDLTDDIVKICNFVNTIKMRPGSTTHECYAIVLGQVFTDLSWTPGSHRVLVMIGDSVPHEPTEKCKKAKIDWMTEGEAWTGGVSIYGVLCRSTNRADMFCKEIPVAQRVSYMHFSVSGFANLFDILIAVCYQEAKDKAKLVSYEKEVREKHARGHITSNFNRIFRFLRYDLWNFIEPRRVSAGAKKRTSKMLKPHAGKLSQRAIDEVVPDKKPYSRKQTRTKK